MSTAIKSRGPLPQQNRDVPYVFLRIPPEAHSLEGFRKWVLSDEVPEKLRVMFLKGEVYLDMSKEDLRNHVALKGEIYRVLSQLNHELDLGDFFPDGALITNQTAKVSNNPDGVAVLWGSLAAGKVRYVKEMEVEGSPDWVLEVVSPSSVFKDTVQLRQAYHEAGIQEYWLVDARGSDIKFQILQWRKTSYVASSAKEGWHRSKVFARSFRLTRRRDRRGAWKYLLEVRE